MRKALLFFFGIVYILITVNIAYAEKAEKTEKTEKPENIENVPYAELKRSPRKEVFFLGTVKLSRSVKLSFLSNVQITYVVPENEEVRGKITNSEGEIIRQGDILAKARDIKERIIVSIASQKLKKAEQTEKDSKMNLERVEKLFKRRVLSERQYEEAQNEYLQASRDQDVCRLELLEAKENADNQILRAPFSGIVEKVFAAAGSSLPDDKEILVLSVYDPVHIKVVLHDVLTDLVCVDNDYWVYPTGLTTPQEGWLKTQGIFTDYVELSVNNKLVSKRKITPAQEKLPKIYSRRRTIVIPEIPEVSLWVPVAALNKDDQGYYIWTALDERKTVTEHIVTCKKIRVNPEDMFVQTRGAQYQALKPSSQLKESQVVLMKTEGNLTDGGKAVVQDQCWLFQPDEKVWVSIPELSKHIYTIPVGALKSLEGRDFIFVINKNNKVLPVDVYVYNKNGKTVEIIGKNLCPGMKIVCSTLSQKHHLGQNIKPGKKVDF